MAGAKMKNSILLFGITFLSLGSALMDEWRMNQRAMSVFGARQEGFSDGLKLAQSRMDTEGKLGICYFASLECGARK